MADPAWLSPLEHVLNRRIGESETAQVIFRELAGRRFGIRVHGMPGTVCLTAGAERLQVEMGRDPGQLDASVAGSAVAMSALAAGGGERLIREGMVEFHGDGEIAERFWALLQAIGPEWEEELARLSGDVAAHQIARALRGLGSFAGRTLETLGRDLAEYLQEESRDLAGAGEQETFFGDVDRLREDVDRLEARIARLERRRRPEEGP